MAILRVASQFFRNEKNDSNRYIFFLTNLVCIDTHMPRRWEKCIPCAHMIESTLLLAANIANYIFPSMYINMFKLHFNTLFRKMCFVKHGALQHSSNNKLKSLKQFYYAHFHVLRYQNQTYMHILCLVGIIDIHKQCFFFQFNAV